MQAALYRRLSELVDRSRVERNVGKAVWVKRLFQALDWGNRAAFSMKATDESSFQLSVEDTPVINVLTRPPTDIDSVYAAINRAYNRDVPWVVVTDFSSLCLFGSYWISYPHDVTDALAWRLEAAEFLLEAPKLDLLTPHEVARNEIDQLYEAFPLRKRRLPIDVHLVERMAGWRDMALQVLGGDAAHDDSLIHRLINSLFLVRYLEDAGKQTSQLEEIVELKDTDFEQKLRQILSDAGKRSGYPTVSANQLARLRTSPLRTLIRQLYGYAEWGVRYDFSAMSVDILGRFYEEYLRLRPETRTIRKQSDTLYLFDAPTVELKNVRRDRGIYYTPRFVVHYIVTTLVRRYEATSPKEPPVLVDISCGSGTFLVSALDELLQRDEWRSSSAKTLVGFDNDERAVEAARLNLTAKCIADKLRLPLPSFNLLLHDLLDKGPDSPILRKALRDGEADIVVGNPPYINYEALIGIYDPTLLKSRFALFSKRTDSYMLFIEAAIRILRPGGFCGLVLPNVFLRSASGAHLRRWLSENADILEIIDFQDQPVFQKVGVYVCVLLLRKRIIGQAPSRVAVTKIYNLSTTPASQLAKLSVSAEQVDDGGEAFQAEQPKGGGPWILRNATEETLLAKVKAASITLEETRIELRQGIKTGEDSIFVIESDPKEMPNLEVSKMSRAIEAGIVVPFLRSRDLRRWYGKPRANVIYPYDRNTQKLISWTRLQKEFPVCASYLSHHKNMLAKRRSLGKAAWYGLIRPRTTTVFSTEPKLFIGELTLRPLICANDGPMAAIAGSTGGGSWIVINTDEILPGSLMAYMNSVVAEWYLRQVSSLRRGGWLLVEQQTVENLPVPKFLKDESSFARSELDRIAKLLQKKVKDSSGFQDTDLRKDIASLEQQIDSLVIGALELSADEAVYIRKRVIGLRGAGAVRVGEEGLI